MGLASLVARRMTKAASTKSRVQGWGTGRPIRKADCLSRGSWRNRRASSLLSPIAALPLSTLLSGRVSTFLPQKSRHVNPPIPLFKIPRAEWPQVVRRVAQGESLRQIARSYHTSHEAVRRVLSVARKELVAGEGALSMLAPEDTEE